MVQDAAGFVWFGTKHGLARHDGYSQWIYRRDPEDSNSLANENVRAICEDRKRNLWVATEENGLYRRDAGTGLLGRISSHESIHRILLDQAGVLWFGTEQGLKSYDAATRSLVSSRTAGTDSVIHHEPIVAMVEDAVGNLWLGTHSGKIIRLNSKRSVDGIYSLNASDVKGDALLGLCAGKFGEVWAGLCRSVARYNPAADVFEPLPVSLFGDERPEARITSILERRDGSLWIGSTDGLIKLGTGGTVMSRFHHQADVAGSLRSDNIAALMEDASGMLWISTDKGGIDKLLEPAGGAGVLRPEPFIPPVAVTNFMLFDNSNKDFVRGREYLDSIEISYRDNFFALGFSVLDYRSPSENQYAFMLEGFDNDWRTSGTPRFARYANVPPGSYVFRVKGAGKDRVWNETATPMRIIITPPFWRTGWFYVLAAIALAGLALVFQRLRAQRQVQRILEIERVRAAENRLVRQRAADDFHDEFGHKLTRISLLSQVMKRSVSNGHTEQLEKIIQTSDDLSVGMRDFLWSLNPEKDSAGDIAIRLKDFGDGLFDGSGIAFRVEGEGAQMENVGLALDWRRHLLLIFKEAMNNAAKHSGCTNVLLDMSCTNGLLSIRLQDDGKGFDPSASTNGQGLEGMRKRAEKIHGTLSITPAEGGGTLVGFTGTIPTYSEAERHG
jgi:signal transduction histidine kinase/streptogramin lyase